MLCACVDIGSNTTRLLVAEVGEGGFTEVLSRRAFTRLGRELRATGALPAARLEELADIVAAHCRLAEEAGAEALRVVATAAIRGAANPGDLVAEVGRRAGVAVDVLDGAEEARLAFAGATRVLTDPPDGAVAVVDVGGGSTEIAVGAPGGAVTWWCSVEVGSGTLADAHVRADPPTPAELRRLREEAAAALAGIEPPAVEIAIAVGGSATSLGRLVGPVIDDSSVTRGLEALCGAPSFAVASRAGLEPERVRLLPAGLAVLSACAGCLRAPLRIGSGGLREGVCLELAAVP